MPTIFRSSTLAGGTSGIASGSAPNGTSAGDLVIAVLHVNGLSGTADDNGATPFVKDLSDFQENNAGMELAVYGRRILDGDPTTFNFTVTAGDRWTLILLRFSDPHPTARYDELPQAVGYNSQATFDAPSVTPDFNGAIHVVVGGVDGGGNSIASVPAGYTVIQNGGVQATAVAYKVMGAAGLATGAQTFTPTTANGEIGCSFLIMDNQIGWPAGQSPRRAAAMFDARRLN